MTGYFTIPRGLLDLPVFGNEPFSRRDAFVWLVENACWKPTRVAIAGHAVELARGQLSYSVRYLSKAWGWETTKTHRYLARLKTASLIETETATGQVVITICNYDRFQTTKSDTATPSETTDATAMQQQCNGDATNNEELKNLETKKKEEGGAPVSEPDVDGQSDPSQAGSSLTSTPPIQTKPPENDPEEFDLIPLALDRRPEALAVKAYNAMADRAGLAQVQKLHDTRKAKLRARLKDCGGLEGWSVALAKVEASPFLTGQNDRGWRADFDFLMRESSFTKLMEGAYDGRPGGGGGDGFAQALRELATTDNDGGPII